MTPPPDAASLGIADGGAVTPGNPRGQTTLVAKLFEGDRSIRTATISAAAA